MSPLKALWARLAGLRTLLVSILLVLPEILDGLVGFNWADVLPDALQVYSAKIGAALALVRLTIVPAARRYRRERRRRRRRRGENPEDIDTPDEAEA